MKPPQPSKHFKSKKRKAPQEHPPAPEFEEGEVRASAAQPHHPAQYPPAQQPPIHTANGYLPQQNGLADPYGPPPALSEAEVVPLVLELLSWGVHPDYLAHAGVSQAIIDRALQFAQPPPPGPPAVAHLTPDNFQPVPQPASEPSPITPTEPTLAPTPVETVPPSPLHPEPASTTPAEAAAEASRSNELALLEAKTREALLARKLRKNAAARKALADNVDNLFAEVSQPPTPSPPPPQPDEVAAEVDPAAVAKVPSPIPTPVPAPTPTPAPTYFPRVNRRPAAADFLHASSAYDSTPPVRTVFEADQPSQVVIEMSDSDTSDDEEEEAAVLAMVLNKPGAGKAATLSAKQSGQTPRVSPGPANATRSGTPSNSEASAAAKKQLEAKEAEIKKAMDKIKQMELAKKAATAASAASTPTSTSTPAVQSPASGSEGLSVKEQLAAALARAEEAKAKLAELEAARAKVAELKDERKGLLVEVAVEEAAAETKMEIDDSATASEETSADPPVPVPTAQPTHFAPYTSSLSSLTGTSSTALQSFAARRHGVDTARALCAFEANGGVCRDPICEAIHASAFIASDDDVCEFVFAQVCPGTLSAPAKAVWKDGLEKALARVPKPLTLAAGLAAGQVFAKRMAA